VRLFWRTNPADRRLLPEGRAAGPMPWVIAIMMFLMALAGAAGLGLREAARTLSADLADRITIQIVEADAAKREAQARATLALLDRMAGVGAVHRVSGTEIKALLEPWLGPTGTDGELPVPVLIDVDLVASSADRVDAITRAVARVAPTARVDEHARWLSPLSGLIGSLKWLALILVLLMTAATTFTVVLAARAALNTHRATIDVMHLLGATDVQIARLFQRRIALDALFGGVIGLVGATLVILLLGDRIGGVGSELIASASLPPMAWVLLALLPLAGALLATFAARLTVLNALRRIL
jgi:cell division transport system permease protein